jgi:murein DD-endopeptidase MepM/ murein hydrolase activator NlpD
MKQVEEISSQISQYQAQIDELDEKISDLNTKISEAEANLKKAEEDYTKQEELLEARLVATYEAGDTSYLDVLLSSESITDLISNYYLVTEVATNDAELLEKIEEQKKQIETAKQTLETSKNELATSKASKQSVTTQLQASKKQKDSYVAQLSEDEKQTQAEIDQLQADNDKITKELKAAEERYRQQLEALKNKGNSSGSSTSNSGDTFTGGGSGFLQRPVKSGSVTTTMYYSSGKYHGALDYGVPSGTTVYAAADGVVLTKASLSGSYGNYIVIQHVNGLRTWYAHGNGVFYVSAGQTVSKGQAIMQSGNSGNSSGPHLHFEVRVSPYTWSYSGNDSRRDPRNYM